MGGIARLARELGWQVSGSDGPLYPPMSTELAKLGVTVHEGYTADALVPHPDEVIVGNVMSRGNPALEYVLNADIPYMSGPAWLARYILSRKKVLAVSGTHGKTTTTALLTWILHEAKLSPGYLIGGVANGLPGTAAVGEGDYFVIEADEYDSAFYDKRPKFLHYRPDVLMINNIEFDHGDIYADLAAIERQFHYLVRTVPGQGAIIVPSRDATVNRVLAAGCWSHRVTVGAEGEWDYVLHQPDGREFSVVSEGRVWGPVRWSLIGEHNVSNAVMAIVAAMQVGVDISTALAALATFAGVKRRLEHKGEVNGITVFDDFAHHPTAIAKTVEGFRRSVGDQARIIVVAELASNTMSQGLHDPVALGQAFNAASRVVLLQPARFTVDLDAFAAPVEILASVDNIMAHLKDLLRSGDYVLILSNKGFGGLPDRLVAELALRT